MNQELDNKLISIIVPVYNVENYIQQCLKSLMVQTYKNIEIIIIDDGSTDNTGKICDDYAKIDNRITIVHKKNEGVSSARNTGLNIAKGEIIAFCDGDDYPNNNMYELMYNKMKEYDADIVISNYNIIKNDKVIQKPDFKMIPNLMNKNEFLYYMSGKYYRGFTANKLYNKSLISKSKVFFNNDITRCEDMLFNVQLSEFLEKAVYINEHLYNYRFVINSASHCKYNSAILSELEAYEMIIYNVEKISKTNKIKYEEACLETALGIRHLYITSKIKNMEDYEYINKIIDKYYYNVMKFANIGIKRKIYFMFCKKSPILSCYIKNIYRKFKEQPK